MRVLNAIRRLLLLLILIPVVAICLDTLLRLFGARPRNPIVSGVRDVASFFIIEPFRTVFPNQSYLQDAAVALVAFGILALLIVFLFRGLASMVGARPAKVQPAPAKPRKPEPAAPISRPGASTGSTPPAQDAATGDTRSDSETQATTDGKPQSTSS